MKSPRSHQYSRSPRTGFRKTLTAAIAVLACSVVVGQASPIRLWPFSRSEVAPAPAPSTTPSSSILSVKQQEQPPQQPQQPEQPSILIVGGGPVGIYTGIALLQKGYTNVTIIEKRPQFTRDQVVDVYHEQALGILNNQAPTLGCWHLPPSVSLKAQCFVDEIHATDFTSVEMYKGFKLRDIQLGLLKEYKALQGAFVIKEFKTAVEAGEVDASDVVICADGARSECRETLIQTPMLRAAGPDVVGPDAYGSTAIIQPEHIPAEIKSRFYNDKELKKDAPQQRFRGFATPDGLVYLGMQLKKEEFEAVGGKPSLDNPVIQDRIKTGLAHCGFTDLTPIALQKAQLTSFPISLGHQPSDGFAKKGASKATGKDQLRFVVGDAGINVHYFSGSGVNLGFGIADASVDTFPEVGSAMDYAGMVERINAAAFKIASEGIQRSFKVILPATAA
ncbi:hypothetical protein HK102_004521 [Quaeritorhiza haematococci]|nr:hypothetical protein HK102_004521 [Quaeritorhiza haematococci]